jgi:hypothetical protein
MKNQTVSINNNNLNKHRLTKQMPNQNSSHSISTTNQKQKSVLSTLQKYRTTLVDRAD